MKAKERHKLKILEYLANPENDVPNREGLAYICGIKKCALYVNFTPAELSDLEAEGLKRRREKYAAKLAKVDIAVLNRAAEGDSHAAKLAYQRFEGWSEKQQVDNTSSDGSMQPKIIILEPGDARSKD